MANYDHIVRIVIRKPTSLLDCCQAFEKLEDAKRRLDTLQIAAQQGIIPRTVFNYQMNEIDDLIYQATRLAGFDNPSDMKYYIENFN